MLQRIWQNNAFYVYLHLLIASASIFGQVHSSRSQSNKIGRRKLCTKKNLHTDEGRNALKILQLHVSLLFSFLMKYVWPSHHVFCSIKIFFLLCMKLGGHFHLFRFYLMLFIYLLRFFEGSDNTIITLMKMGE